ncbi:hypothetical protein CEP52_002315 [Fusarium oligoseptatum]|uniref:Uncharacterized protein n=1 Tax=Fusarium oligoseptatum TaxID=2604345 RepID=A0A428UEG3_9HYPO|nr:hypothetical protein CEP52_002315 [Fusarium oligoseptatum]
MAITVWLLVSHDTAIIPGQWSIFVSADKTRPGIIFNNYGAAPGISINPLVTASAIMLDVITNPGPDCSKNMRDIAKAIVLPEKPPGTPPSVADSEVWASINDFVIDRRETVSVITLGAVLDSELPLLEEIAAEVDMPWPKGACSKNGSFYLFKGWSRKAF